MTDYAFSSVYVANTPSRAAVFFEHETLKILKSFLGVEENRPLYLKVVASDDKSVTLQPSAVRQGRYSGFFLLSPNAGTMGCPLDMPRPKAFFGKTATEGFLQIGNCISESRIVVKLPDEKPEPTPVPYTPKAMITGFRRVNAPVVYECERTGERFEFGSEAEAQKRLAGRAKLMDFCAKHDIKFERNATIEAIIRDPATAFEAISEMLA